MKTTLFILLALFTFTSFSQTLPLKWYFGYQAGLNFTKGSPYVVRGETGITTQKGIQNKWMTVENEPFLVMGDEDGKVLFYSDGTKIWNDKYRECDSILSASRSHSQILGVKIPKSENKYLVITPFGVHDFVEGWNYTEVEVGEKPKVIKANETFIKGKFMQGAVIVPHCNGVDYWAVFHKAGKNNKEYYSYLINKKGIQYPVISKGNFGIPAGNDTTMFSAISNMTVNNGFNVIATAFHGQGKNGGVELMEFDNKNGHLKKAAWLNNFTDPSDVYGVCFSPNDSLLYVTECEGEKVNQYRIYYERESKINASRMVLHHGSQTNARFGQIQMGPDSALYIPSDFNGRAYELGCNFIGVIKKPNELGGKAKWRPEEICIPVDYNMHTGLGLPSLNKFHKDCPQEKIVEVVEEAIVSVPEEEPTLKISQGDTIILENLVFESGSFELTDSAKVIIEDLYLALLNDHNLELKIEGHTDDIGAFRDNLRLSRNRALSVKNYLIERGISASRLSSKGFGESLPKTPNINKASRAINRRVEFIIK